MDQNLRVLFERALGDEPVPPTGNLAQEAMVRGAVLRRRRNLLAVGGAAGVVAVVAAMVALNTAATGGTAPPVMAAGALMPSANAACTFPAHGVATDVRVFLQIDIADEQRLDLDGALRSDPLVRRVTFVNREQAYARFRQNYKDSPDVVDAVTAEQLPESFHVTLADPAEYLTFVAKYHGMPGIDEMVGRRCPEGSGSGEGE